MRANDEEPLGVDFVVVEDADAVEPAAIGVSRPIGRSPARGPGRRLAGLAAVVLAATGLVVRVVSSHDSFRPAARANTAPAGAPSPSPLSLWQLDAGTGRRVRVATIPVSCPAVACTVDDTLPPGFVAAVRARLPLRVVAEHVQARTEGGQPVYRRLVASGAGNTTITVTLAPAPSDGHTMTSGERLTAGKVVGWLTFPSGGSGLVVTVEVSGPARWEPPMDAMRALAEDPRLLQPG